MEYYGQLSGKSVNQSEEHINSLSERLSNSSTTAEGWLSEVRTLQSLKKGLRALYRPSESGGCLRTPIFFYPGSPSELLLQHHFRIVGLAHVQAVLLTFLSPVEVPVRTPPCSGLGVGPILELEDSAAVVAALNYGALLNELLASTLDGFADPLKVRSAQGGDSFEDLVPKGWVVERTFSWTDQNRRMSKDYERLTETGETFIYVAMSRLMARRLARS